MYRVMFVVGQILGWFFLIASIFLLPYLAWNLFIIGKTVVAGTKTLSPEVYVPLIVTLSAAIIGLFSTLYVQRKTRLMAIEADFRQRKTEIYLDFLNIFKEILDDAQSSRKTKPLDYKKQILDIRTKAVLWGSPEILKALSDFVKVDSDPSLDIWEIYDRIQREMRKDIGLSNNGLDKDFFVELILSNKADLAKLRAMKKVKPT